MRKLLTLITVSLFFSGMAFAEQIKVACIGDSITFGARVKDRGNNSYPAKLQKLLGEGYQVKNFGVNGSTLLKKGDKPYWKQGAYKKSLDFKPNIIIIKLGTNDTKPQNWKHSSDFKNDLKEMVKSFQSLDSKPKVYLCKPVPAYETRWGINDKTVKEGVIPVVESVAKELNLQVIDLYTALSNKPEMFPDKIHPNAKGAAIMAATVKELIEK